MRNYDDFENYRGDIIYDTWLSGGNPDIIDDDQLRDAYERDEPEHWVVEDEVRRQRRSHNGEES